MLEHYLVNYAHGKLFPLGAQESSQNLKGPRSIRQQYALLAAYYAIIETLLVGAAGLHKTGFGAAHVIKVVQSSAKTFEHSVAFPERALRQLSAHGLETCTSLGALLQN